MVNGDQWMDDASSLPLKQIFHGQGRNKVANSQKDLAHHPIFPMIQIHQLQNSIIDTHSFHELNIC
jgi:hypothetical protein